MNNVKYKIISLLLVFCLFFTIMIPSKEAYAQAHTGLFQDITFTGVLGAVAVGIAVHTVNSYNNITSVIEDVYSGASSIYESAKSSIASGISSFRDLFSSTRADVYSHYEPSFGLTDYMFADGYSMKEGFDWLSIGVPTAVDSFTVWFDDKWETDQKIYANTQFIMNNGDVVNGSTVCKSISSGKERYSALWEPFLLAYGGYSIIDEYTNAMSPLIFNGSPHRISNYSYDELLNFGTSTYIHFYGGIQVEKDGVYYEFRRGATDYFFELEVRKSSDKTYVKDFRYVTGSGTSYFSSWYPLTTDVGTIDSSRIDVVSDGTNTYTIEEAEAEGLATVKSVIGGTADTYDEETYQKKLNDVITLGSAGAGLLSGKGISEGIGDPTLDVLVDNGVISADGNIVPENLASIDELINTTTDLVLQQDLIAFRDAYIRELEIELEKALTTSVPIAPDIPYPENIFDPPSNRINFDPFKDLGITSKFPFSLPWDIQYLINLFSGDPVTPKFEFSFPFSDLGVGFSDFTFSKSLDFLDPYIGYFHFFIVVSFTLGLVLLSFKFL